MSPKVSTPQTDTAPVAPTTISESSSAQEEYQKQKRKYLNSQGRASTLLSGGNYGIGGKTLLGQ